MNLYLVQGFVYSTPYGGDRTMRNDIRLVRAEDTHEAERKYEAYWENRSEPYSQTYEAILDTISEVIE